jgi:predicted phosphodiesterase
MRVGVVSNSTGAAAEALTAAAELLAGQGAELILHCGDVGGRRPLDALARYDAGFVWGDRDAAERMSLLRHAQYLNLPCYGVLASLELAGKRVAIVHGDDPALTRRLLDEQQHDYLLTGHAPHREDRRVGKTRVIHPGSLAARHEATVALLDLGSGHLEFLVPQTIPRNQTAIPPVPETSSGEGSDSTASDGR